MSDSETDPKQAKKVKKDLKPEPDDQVVIDIQKVKKERVLSGIHNRSKGAENSDDSISSDGSNGLSIMDIMDGRTKIKLEDLKKYGTLTDIRINNTTGEFTREEQMFLKKIMEIASISKKRHSQEAGKYRRNTKIFGTVSQILATLAGSAGIGSLLSLDPSDKGFGILFTISIIALMAALSSTLQRSLDFENKAISHKTSSKEYGSIITKTAQFLSTPGQQRKDIEIFTNSIVIEMNVVETNDE